MHLVESTTIALAEREPLILNLFKSASGLWSGEMFCGEDCINTVAASTPPREVQQAAFASKLFADRVRFV